MTLLKLGCTGEVLVVQPARGMMIINKQIKSLLFIYFHSGGLSCSGFTGLYTPPILYNALTISVYPNISKAMPIKVSRE